MSKPVDYDRSLRTRPRLRDLSRPEPEALTTIAPTVLHGNSWLADYFNIAKRRWGLIAACILLGGLTGFVLLLFQPPVYTAVASVEFVGYSDTFMDAQNVDPQSSGDGHAITSVNLQTQLRLLQSKALIEAARARLNGEYLKADAPRRDPLASFRHLVGVRTEDRTERIKKATDLAASTLDAEILTGTRIIYIQCDSTEPSVASAFVNALAENYVTWSSMSRLKGSKEASRWLNLTLEGARAKLAQAEGDLHERQLRSDLPSDKTSSLAETTLRQLQVDVSAAENDFIAKQSRYLSSQMTPAEYLPEVRDDPAVRGFQVQVSTLRHEMANLSTTLGPKHIKVIQFASQINALEKTITTEQETILNRIKNDYEAARRKQQLLSDEYAKQSGTVSQEQRRELSYVMAKREVDTARQEYETLLQRAQQAQVVSMIPVTTAQVIDLSTPPELPSRPRPTMFVGLGLATGTFLGWIFAYFRESSDPRVRRPKQLSALLRVRTLGVIPSSSQLDRGTRRWRVGAANGRDRPEQLELASLKPDPSAMAESFRAALASIMMEDDTGYRPKIILVTSAVPREGKTLVCCNLAVAMAETGRKVLLIDADMRRPRLDKIFGTTPEPTLLNVVNSPQGPLAAPVDKLVQPTAIENLKVLPSTLAGSQTASVVYSDGLRDLIDRVRDEFHAVLIDAPPLSPFYDARVIGRLVDGAILVLRSNYSDGKEAQDALQQLSEDGIPVIGAILNDCRPENKLLRRLYDYHNPKPRENTLTPG